MVYNEALHTVVKTVLNRQLGKAIGLLENYLYTYQQLQYMELLQELKADYELMVSYWEKGYQDVQRGQLYDQLLRRMYVLATNIYILYYRHSSSYVYNLMNTARSTREHWTPDLIRAEMENFVTDVALLELEPEHVRRQRQQTVYEQHERKMASLFDYLWTTQLWADSVTEAFEEMLLTPTIDPIDQQLIVSSITLTAMNFWDANKFKLLISVYRKATNEHVRQRALIGWAFCLNSEVSTLYPELRDTVRQVTADERCCNELAELQMQLIYCMQAEKDTRKIQDEIMPELLKNNNIRITRNGIEEVDEDPMDDVLHPELSEQRMEKLEANVRKMIDMQKQGSDIYFGGFSQMKRFPFFNKVANWFVPYYPQHPAVSSIINNVRGKKFLDAMLSTGPFCDSDKYSFAIAFESTVRQLPEGLMAMLDRGEATLAGAGEMTSEELASPAFLRRSYLQDLYRFFRVYPMRGEFVNPFSPLNDGSSRYLFMASPLFQGTRLESKFGELVAFFIKHRQYEAAKLMLQNYREEQRDAQFYLMNGSLLLRTHDAENAGLTARDCFSRVVELEPDNERAWSGYARTLFGEGDYAQSLKYYNKLLDRHPDHQNYQLNAAVCLTNMRQYDEALKILFKLNYEAPDNANFSRVLAWALVGAGKYEQAGRIYEELLGGETPEPDDLLNAAYYHWFSGDVAGAVSLFRRYAKQDGIQFDAEREFFGSDYDMIKAHGVGDVEIRLMAGELL